jgi:DNA-binding transcriptional regulator YiaG
MTSKQTSSAAPATSRPLTREQQRRFARGELLPGDVAALVRSVGLTPAALSEALGISRRTLENWLQDRVTPVGSALALLRIVARHPGILKGISRAP